MGYEYTEKSVFIKPKKPWRILQSADDGNYTTYIYGITGTGKTTLVKRYLKDKKYTIVDAVNIDSVDLSFDSKATRQIVVVDNIHEIAWGDVDEARDRIIELIKREDVWVILISRSPVPPWLSAARFNEGFYIIDSKMLLFRADEIKKYMHDSGINFSETQQDRLVNESTGLPLALKIIADLYRELGYGDSISDSQYDLLAVKVMEQMCDYLEYSVYDNWDIEMQEFLMEISVVEEFNAAQAEMITGRSNSEILIERAKWLGNFMTSKVGADGTCIYMLRDEVVMSMRRRLVKKFEKERVNNLYENAGLYFRLNGQIKEALEMYEQAKATERIVAILVDNARRSPNNGFYNDLKKYYLALPENVIRKSPELMSGMSMLKSLLMDPEESERWYDELKSYCECHRGSERKIAKSLLVYLDIALPHRGSGDVPSLIKAAYTKMFNKEIKMPELSVTSNLPSQMNGGKDFCEWTKNEYEIIAHVGRFIEIVLGKYGKSVVNLGLAESLLEKGGDNYEIATLATKGRMQAEAAGKLEQCFVADGILSWLHLQNGKPKEAMDILTSIEEKAICENMSQLIPNIKAFKVRCCLYSGDKAEVSDWLLNAPDENIEFRILDRFQYLTKVRVYLQNGRNEKAYELLTELFYYADMMKRTYIDMECKVLMAITQYRSGNDSWRQTIISALDKAHEYKFVRVISREGAAVYPLLTGLEWPLNADGDNNEKDQSQKKAFFRTVLKETEKMTRHYPGYLKAGASEVLLSETAISILKLQAEGLSRAKIAERLNMSEANVKYHLTQTYRKLGATDKTGAVMEAGRRGII